jgi:hypothetical protein
MTRKGKTSRLREHEKKVTAQNWWLIEVLETVPYQNAFAEDHAESNCNRHYDCTYH